MRILLILLIAGFCLVTAKYIPHETSDTNLVLHRVRRADHDSDSNAATVERDDDSSNDNDNDDGDDNDSREKIKEEQTKLREKEENKKQKLLERIEKEKQKEIEEKRKQEEKLAKEKGKEEERKEKEERKLAESIEKQKRKVEEEKKKVEQKLEKEERKRQEKLKKQVEKIHKEQIDSAEDGYLETEEEDSVEIEDIWKAHVYDKYGISVTSTKLERQAALQRYLQEEMSINANSTKSERRQAIIKLIQTKLQNDSATVDSFRNLLLSHVNAAQIQKLRAKLENDLEELDNQTVLLNNLSLPWASIAQQNIEEKRTFLQTIAQFLSNIVPNWFTGDQSSGNPNQLDGNEIASNSATPTNPNVPNIASGSGQSSQPTSSNDSGSLNTGVACGENNLSVLPSNVGSISSSNNPSKPNGMVGSDSLNNNAPVSQTEVNELPLNSGNSANVDSPNALAPPGLSTNQSQSNLSGGSASLNDDVPVSEANLNGPLSNTGSLGDSESLNIPAPENPVPPPSDPSEQNGGSDSVNNNTPVSQTNGNGLLPSNSDNTVNSDTQNASASTDLELNSGNSFKPVAGSQNNVDSSNVPTLSGSGLSTSNPSEPTLSGGSGSVNNNIPVSETNANGVPSSNGSLSNSESSNTPVPENFGLSPSNPSGLNEGSDSLNNNVPVSQPAGNGPSNNGNTVNSDLLNGSASSNFGTTPSNSLEPNESGSSSSLDNNTPVDQNDVNGLPSNTANSDNTETLNLPASSDPGLSTGNPSEPNLSGGSGSVNNNVPVSETNANGLPSNTGSLSNSESSNTPVPKNSGLSVNSPSGLNGGSDSLNNNIPVSQPASNGPSNNGNIVNLDLLNGSPSTDSGSTPGNSLEPSGPASSNSINNNVPLNQNDVNGLPSDTADSVNTEASYVPAPPGSGLSADNASESNISGGSGSLNNNVPISESNVNGLPSSTISTNSDSSNAPAIGNLGLASSNPSESLGSGSLKNNVPIDQSDVNGHSPTTDSSINFNSSDSAALIGSGSSTGNQLESIGFVTSSSLNNNVPVSQTDGNGLSSNADNTANVVSTNLPASTDTVTSPSKPDLNESVGSDPIRNNDSVTTTDVNGLSTNTDSVSSDSQDASASVDSVLTLGNQLKPNGPVSSTSLKNGIPVSLTNVNELPSNSDNSSNIANVPGSESSPSNPLNDVTSPGSVNLSGDVANDQIEELIIPAEAATPSASESSHATPLTGSEQTSDNPGSSTVFGDSISLDNNVAVTSSTPDEKHGVYIENSDANAVNSSNGENVPMETIVGANNIDEAANSGIVDSNAASFSNKSVQLQGDAPVGSTDVSINGESELGQTTVSSIAVYDISTPADTETISSVAVISSLSNSNGNDVINSATAGSFGSNDISSNPETVTNIISTDTQAVDQNPISQDTSIINTEATNVIVEENVNAGDQKNDFLTTPVAEADEIVTQHDAQTETAILGVQEIVNTPSDLVTVASVQPPPSLTPYLGVDIPNEDAATIVDIKLN